MAGPVPTAIAEEKTPSLPTSASASQQAGASQGVDVISELMKQGSDADLAAAQAAKAATIPISGGHTTPQAVMLPGGGQQHPQLAMDTNPVVGHHQAMMRGVANATRGVANLVSSLSTQIEQKQTQRLAVNMERLMTATQSIDQAKQVLQQDPNNKDAQDQLKKSGAIMDEVLSDDKTRKSIQKAYNINFADPSKNNTKEHAALKMATDSYKDQFQRQLPQQMAPNQAAIEQAKLAQAQAVATHKTIDAIVPAIMRTEATRYSADTRATAAKEIEQSRETAAAKVAKQRSDDAYTRAVKVARINGYNHLAGISQAQQAIDGRFYDKLDAAAAAAGGKLSGMKSKDLLGFIHEIDAKEEKFQVTRGQFITARDKMKTDKHRFDQKAVDAANMQIDAMQTSMQQQLEIRKSYLEELDRRDKLASGNTTQSSSGTGQSGSSAPNTQTPSSVPTSRTGTTPESATPTTLGGILDDINQPGPDEGDQSGDSSE